LSENQTMAQFSQSLFMFQLPETILPFI